MFFAFHVMITPLDANSLELKEEMNESMIILIYQYQSNIEIGVTAKVSQTIFIYNNPVSSRPTDPTFYPLTLIDFLFDR